MSTTGRTAPGSERGSATVLAGAAVGVVVLVLTGALLLVSVVHDVHRARAAADLAALAAAGTLLAGGAASCSEGGALARANGAIVSRCELLPDGSVQVAVVVPLRASARWAGLASHATASARAGLAPAVARPLSVAPSGHLPRARQLTGTKADSPP